MVNFLVTYPVNLTSSITYACFSQWILPVVCDVHINYNTATVSLHHFHSCKWRPKWHARAGRYCWGQTTGVRLDEFPRLICSINEDGIRQTWRTSTFIQQLNWHHYNTITYLIIPQPQNPRVIDNSRHPDVRQQTSDEHFKHKQSVSSGNVTERI